MRQSRASRILPLLASDFQAKKDLHEQTFVNTVTEWLENNNVETVPECVKMCNHGALVIKFDGVDDAVVNSCITAAEEYGVEHAKYADNTLHLYDAALGESLKELGHECNHYVHSPTDSIKKYIDDCLNLTGDYTENIKLKKADLLQIHASIHQLNTKIVELIDSA